MGTGEETALERGPVIYQEQGRSRGRRVFRGLLRPPGSGICLLEEGCMAEASSQSSWSTVQSSRTLPYCIARAGPDLTPICLPD